MGGQLYYGETKCKLLQLLYANDGIVLCESEGKLDSADHFDNVYKRGMLQAKNFFF